MPNIPKTGAAGQIDQGNPFAVGGNDSEAGEPLADPTTGGRPNINAALTGNGAAAGVPVPFTFAASDNTETGEPWADPTTGKPTVNASVAKTGAAGGYEIDTATRRPPSQPGANPKNTKTGPVPLT